MSRDLMHDSMIKAMDTIRSFLYYIDGFSHKEIARALNITEGGSTSIPAAAAVLLLLLLLPINRTPAVIGKKKCSDFGKMKCSKIGNNGTVFSATRVQYNWQQCCSTSKGSYFLVYSII